MKAEDIRRRLAELALDTNEYRINAGGNVKILPEE